MPTKLVRLLLFLSSYFPLSLIFCFLYLEKYLWVALSFLGFGSLGLFGLFGFFSFMRNKVQPENIELITVKSREDESMGYIVSYIIPFLSISTSQGIQRANLRQRLQQKVGKMASEEPKGVNVCFVIGQTKCHVVLLALDNHRRFHRFTSLTIVTQNRF